MKRIIALAAFGSLLAGSAYADDPPDYLTAMGRIDKAVNYAYSFEMCQTINYRMTGEAVDPVKAAVAEGARNGVSSSFGMTHANQAIEERKADETLIASEAGKSLARAFNAKDMDGAVKAATDFYDYWDGKCQSFADDEQFSDFIKEPVDSDAKIAGFSKFMDLINPVKSKTASRP